MVPYPPLHDSVFSNIRFVNFLRKTLINKTELLSFSVIWRSLSDSYSIACLVLYYLGKQCQIMQAMNCWRFNGFDLQGFLDMYVGSCISKDFGSFEKGIFLTKDP